MKAIFFALAYFLFIGAASADETGPELIREVLPTYPKNAESMDITGWVLLRYDVNEEGRVENITIVDSHDEGPITSKYALRNFEKNSIKALRKFRYEPGKPSEGLMHLFDFGVDAGYGSILRREMLLTGGSKKE